MNTIQTHIINHAFKKISSSFPRATWETPCKWLCYVTKFHWYWLHRGTNCEAKCGKICQKITMYELYISVFVFELYNSSCHIGIKVNRLYCRRSLQIIAKNYLYSLCVCSLKKWVYSFITLSRHIYPCNFANMVSSIKKDIGYL